MNKTRGLLVIVFLLAIAFCGTAAARGTGPAGSRDARMRWWREARFGMFIH